MLRGIISITYNGGGGGHKGGLIQVQDKAACHTSIDFNAFVL